MKQIQNQRVKSAIRSQRSTLSSSICEDIEINNCLDHLQNLLNSQKNNLETLSNKSGTMKHTPLKASHNIKINSDLKSSMKKNQYQINTRLCSDQDHQLLQNHLSRYQDQLKQYDVEFKNLVNENCELKIQNDQLKQLNQIQSSMLEDQRKYYETMIKSLQEGFHSELRYLKVTKKDDSNCELIQSNRIKGTIKQ